MKENITLTIDAKTHEILKDEAKRRKITMKQLGEEYFYKMVAKIEEEKNQIQIT
jgi:hypothetical protein